MNSPICFLCHADFRSEYFHFQTGGGLVQFADYKPLLEGAAGHPQGLEWFCNSHLPVAEDLASSTTEEALSRLKLMFGEFPPYEPEPVLDPELWVTSVGPNSARVFAILRQATQLAPIDAKAQLQNGAFKVAQGWPKNFENWRSALVEAGAQVEIRFP